MEIQQKKPPRKFTVGRGNPIEISDCAEIFLNPDEQVTFVTKDKRECDYCAKEWGYYVTPSVNKRLVNNGFKTALVKNPEGFIYVNVVDKNKVEEFFNYLKGEKSEVLEWLDERR